MQFSSFSGLPQLQAAFLGATIQILLSLLQVLANSARDCHSPGHRGMVIIALLSAAGLVAPLCPSGIGRRPFKYDLYSIGCPYCPVTASIAHMGPIANPLASAAFACPVEGGCCPLMLPRCVQSPTQMDNFSGLPLQPDDDDLPKNT